MVPPRPVLLAGAGTLEVARPAAAGLAGRPHPGPA